MHASRPLSCIAGGKPCGIPGTADEEDRKIFLSKLMPESENVGLQPGLGSARTIRIWSKRRARA